MSVITEFEATEIVSRANVNQRIADANSVLSSVVPSTRTINGKPLSADITLSAADVGAIGNGVEGTITFDPTYVQADRTAYTLQRSGNFVFFEFAIGTASFVDVGYSLGTFPEGFRPASYTKIMMIDSENQARPASLASSGVLTFQSKVNYTSPVLYGTAIYLAAN